MRFCLRISFLLINQGKQSFKIKNTLEPIFKGSSVFFKNCTEVLKVSLHREAGIDFESEWRARNPHTHHIRSDQYLECSLLKDFGDQDQYLGAFG